MVSSSKMVGDNIFPFFRFYEFYRFKRILKHEVDAKNNTIKYIEFIKYWLSWVAFQFMCKW